MARIDKILSKYDLKTLEAVVEKRRRLEKKKLATLQAQRKKLETELQRVEQELQMAAAPTRS